jgi:hypothetical protein
MKSFENNRRRQPHLEISEKVTEPQAVISWGEDFLDRAHEVGHDIEQSVQRLLGSSGQTHSHSSPHTSDHSISNRHARGEQGRSRDAVDKRNQR